MVNPDPAPQKTEDVDRGRRFVFLAALLWSLGGVFIKFLNLHPLTIVFYRSLFAALVFLPFLNRPGRPLSVPVVVSVISYSAAITAFVTANKSPQPPMPSCCNTRRRYSCFCIHAWF
jgi:hypothetical protein